MYKPIHIPVGLDPEFPDAQPFQGTAVLAFFYRTFTL